MCFNKMWLNTVFVLIFSSVLNYCAGEEGDLTMKLVIKKDGGGRLICLNDAASTKLVEGKMIKVVVESHVAVANDGGITCLSNYNQIFNITKQFKEDDNGCYNAEKNMYVGTNWSKNWKCNFYGSQETCAVTVDIRSSDLEPYVEANRMELKTTSAKETDTFDSVTTYDFYDGEYVKFTCLKKNNKIITLLKLISNAYGNIKTKSRLSPDPYLYLKLTKENNKNYIVCRADEYSGKNSFVTRINLRLSSRKPDLDYPVESFEAPPKCGKTMPDGKVNCVNGTGIEGLTGKNILGISNSFLNMLSIIYEYHDNDILNLTCDALEPKWIYNDTKFERVNSSFAEIAQGSKNFKLKSNETRANITCISLDKSAGSDSVEIIIIRKEDHPDTNSTKNPDHAHSGNTSESVTDEVQGGGTGKGLGHKTLIIIAVCALVFIGVLIFITIQLWKRKPVPPNPDSNVNYENLPENNSNMAVPSQWQEAQYSAPADRVTNNDYAVPYKPNLDEMYATPIPKTQRLDKDNPAHASVDNLSPTCKTVPKHLRNGIAVLPTNMDSTYAELSLKPGITKKPNLKNVTPRENPYAHSESPYEEVRSNENPYAEVAFSENSYAEPSNLQSKNYANVFNDPRYVNADAKEDYAEPAYCEISKFEK